MCILKVTFLFTYCVIHKFNDLSKITLSLIRTDIIHYYQYFGMSHVSYYKIRKNKTRISIYKHT